MVLKRTAIESDLLNAGRQRALGNRPANRLGRGAVAAVLELAAQFFFDRAGGGHGAAGLVVDQLRADMFMAAENGQTGPQGSAMDSLANAPRASLALLETGPIVIHGSTSTLL
jgi:hypothetical protein